MSRRIAGLIEVAVNGTLYQAKGNFTYDLGLPQREALVGSDKTHGYKETPKVAFIEGEFTDHSDLDLAGLFSISDATVTLKLANGKTVMLSEAWYAGDGKAETEEANIKVRFEGMRAEEIPA